MPKFEPISLSREGENPSYLVPPSPEYDGLHLYVNDPRVVELPEEGCITFRFRRGPVTVTEGKERAGTASVDLTLCEICEVKSESYNEPERYTEKSESAIDKLFEELRGKGEELDGDDSGE